MSDTSTDSTKSTDSTASTRGSYADLVANNVGMVQSLLGAIAQVLGQEGTVGNALDIAREGEVNPDSLPAPFLTTFNLILRSVFAADGTTIKTEDFTADEKAQLASEIVGVLQEMVPLHNNASRSGDKQPTTQWHRRWLMTL
uniref:Transcriptional regulator n=1 Tax=Panagrellus redivivus TaxID=6233 RepID=A0A7E4WC74_PANRE